MLSRADLDTAVAKVESWWRDERKAFQIACALGHGSRLSLEILSELRLILRLMRFRRRQAEFPTATAAICDQPMMAAAE